MFIFPPPAAAACLKQRREEGATSAAAVQRSGHHPLAGGDLQRHAHQVQAHRATAAAHERHPPTRQKQGQ